MSNVVENASDPKRLSVLLFISAIGLILSIWYCVFSLESMDMRPRNLTEVQFKSKVLETRGQAVWNLISDLRSNRRKYSDLSRDELFSLMSTVGMDKDGKSKAPAEAVKDVEDASDRISNSND